MTISALSNFETKSLGKLLRLSKIRQYDDDEQIIKEGDYDPWLYFLLSGKIRIAKEGLTIGHIDKQGEIFGEMGLVSDEPRFATVVAAEDSRLIMVHDKAFHQSLVNEKMPIIKPLIKQLVERLKNVELQNQDYLKRIDHLQNELSYAREKLLNYELAKEE